MFPFVGELFTFSDGIYLPKGTLVAVATHGLHIDKSNYPGPTASFQPFRSVDKTREENGGRKVDMTAIHADWLAFGYGRRACPGRLFATDVSKLLLAHIVVHYDVKLERPRPDNLWVVFRMARSCSGGAQTLGIRDPVLLSSREMRV